MRPEFSLYLKLLTRWKIARLGVDRGRLLLQSLQPLAALNALKR